MPTVRLTDSKKDISKLNRVLTKLTNQASNIENMQKQIASLQQNAAGDNLAHQHILEDNIVFTWTGATLKFSWPAGYIKDRFGIVHQIDAGASAALTASTYYWAIWNDFHRVMAFVTGLDTVQSMTTQANNHNFIVAQIFSGTAAQSGVAGGGGSTTTSGLSSGRYKNF